MFFKTPLAQSANRNFRFDLPLTSTVLLTSFAYNAPSTFSAPAASSGRRDAALTIVVILALLTISRLRGWIDTGEFLSLVIEVLIVVMIGMELKEGADQAKIFSSLEVSARATATTLKGLEQAQKESAETLSQTLATIRQTNAAINNQFSLAKRQYEEGNQRPVLQVRAILHSWGAQRGRSAPFIASPPILQTCLIKTRTGHVISKDERERARNKLKSHLLEESEKSASPGPEYVRGFYPLAKIINSISN